MSLAKSYREVMDYVRKNVIGQSRAIQEVERALKIVQAGLHDDNRPLAILYFAGPTGVGKTEMEKAMAEIIHGNGDKLCRVDCNLLTQSHDAASLTGSPPGYVGSNTGDTILDKKTIEGSVGKPGILVLEEFEKAHPKVWDIFLGIFDKGFINMNNGRGKISFMNTIIIMTSNAGGTALSAAAGGTRVGFARAANSQPLVSADERKSIVMKELSILFKPEFLNRIDAIVVFDWLGKAELDIIVNKFIGQLQQRLFGLSHSMNIDLAAKDFLVAQGTDVANGARPLKRAIRRYLEDPLAEILVDGQALSQFTFRVTHQKGHDKLTITYDEFVRPEPRHQAVVIKPKAPAPEEVPQEVGSAPEPPPGELTE